MWVKKEPKYFWSSFRLSGHEIGGSFFKKWMGIPLSLGGSKQGDAIWKNHGKCRRWLSAGEKRKEKTSPFQRVEREAMSSEGKVSEQTVKKTAWGHGGFSENQVKTTRNYLRSWIRWKNCFKSVQRYLNPGPEWWLRCPGLLVMTGEHYKASLDFPRANTYSEDQNVNRKGCWETLQNHSEY